MKKDYTMKHTCLVNAIEDENLQIFKLLNFQIIFT
jgi:hypothetical protein